MNIIIRTDASIEIGTGHVMRCLTLAKQLKRHGADVTFICRDLEGNMISHLRSENMKVFTLPNAKSTNSDLAWIRENWELDSIETISLVKENSDTVDVMIVDHYSLDRCWEEKVRNIARHIFVIDDLANRPHDCDFLLDQNYYLNMEDRYIHLVPEQCILLLGPDYVLLREEFIEAAKNVKERTGEVENLFVFFGGADPTGETIKALTAIKEMDMVFKNIDVVVGASNPKKDQILKLCEKIKNAHFHCQITNMAELMLRADLAIGAGGATTWERCILGVPSIVVVVAENQRELTEVLTANNVLINIECNLENSKKEFKKVIEQLVFNSNKLLFMSERSRELININKVSSYPVVLELLEGSS